MISVRILIVLTNRVPGVVVALSAIALLTFIFAYFKGGIEAIGIRSRKASAYAMIASVILLVISIFMLFHVK